MNKMQHNLNRLISIWLRVFCLTLLVFSISIAAKAVTVTITCTGATGSYKSGSVNAGGIKNDGNMTTINSNTNRGWAHYDLSSIPAAVIVTAVTTNFTTYSSTTSGAANSLYGFAGDPATIAGATLYANCASGTAFDASAWSAGALQTKVLNASGIAFVQANVGSNNANIGYVRSSANTYNLYGYAPGGLQPPNLVITYTVPPPCIGTPAPGNTLPVTGSFCTGGSVNLTLQNATSGTGVTYQWYKGAIAITGATQASYTATLIGSYHCNVACGGGAPVSSNANTISAAPFVSCYCIPTSTTNACSFGDHITNVTFSAPVNPINNTTGQCLNAGYSSYLASTPVSDVPVASTIPISVTVNNNGTEYAGAWIDFNQSGTFDASEFITLTDADGLAPWIYTGIANIPAGATLGQTALRCRSSFNAVVANSSACATYNYGETEDYLISIVTNPACTGTPQPGNTVANVTSVCPGGSVNLSLSGSTIGTGISYQWSKNSGAIAGATNSFYTVTNITAQDGYYCQVSCSFSGQSNISTPITISLLPFMNCYCASAAANSVDEEIYQVTLNGASTPATYANANGCITPAPGAGSVLSRYSNFTSIGTLVNVMEGQPVPFEIRQNECDGGPFHANVIAVFIDYNHNGSFSDPGEQVYIDAIPSAATGLSPGGDKVVSGTFTTPSGTLLGQTVMRVICAESFSGPLTPCLSYAYGETEDYIINITANINCTGTPNPGQTIASATLVCPNAAVTLSLQNFTTGGAVSYQWNNSIIGPIVGATNLTYTIPSFQLTDQGDYWCVVTCNGSGLSGTSILTTISVNNYLTCYCIPNSNAGSYPASYGGIINNVNINQLNNASGFPATTPYYTNYSPLGTTVLGTTLWVGSIYPLTVVCGQYTQARVWFDWNHDGTFNASESTYLGTSTLVGPNTFVQPIAIPVTAMTGTTRMRIRGEYNFNVLDGAMACTSTSYGETEDYELNVVIPTTCAGAPAPGFAVANPTTVCPGGVVHLSLSNTNLGMGITYQWSNNAGPIAGATNSYYSATMGTTSDNFTCAALCANSGLTGTSVAAAVAITPFTNCYCVAGSSTDGASTFSEYIGNFKFNTINFLSSSQAGTTPPGYAGYTSTSTTVLQGQTYTAEVLIPNWFSIDQASVWIDFNHDGILNDVTEQFVLATGGGNGTTPLSGSITIPATSLTGATRLRVRVNYAGTMSSCGITSYGEVEDYTVVINPVATNTTLNMTCFIQGFWNGTSAMLPVLANQFELTTVGACDSIVVELHDAIFPYALLTGGSFRTVLQQNGTSVSTFPSALNGSYYIVVKHRNVIQTWSANPVSFASSPVSYNFSTAASQAYGSNQIQLDASLWGIYSGDINHDENIDLLDVSFLETDINNFEFGYQTTDINGDGNVDLLDAPYVENNINAFIFSAHP